MPWLGGTDGTCPYCRAGMENLCDRPTFTGYQRDGGYAEYAVARADFALRLPDGYTDVRAAPLLCAGLIGYRALRLAHARAARRTSARLGLYGFGASAHIVIQVARHLGHEVHVVTRGRPGRRSRSSSARPGRAARTTPHRCRSTARSSSPRWARSYRAALGAVRKGGVVVCAGIHMSPIPQFDYDLLWGERVVRSVANLTREDGREFLELAAGMPIDTDVEEFAARGRERGARAPEVGQVRGAAVLIP